MESWESFLELRRIMPGSCDCSNTSLVKYSDIQVVKVKECLEKRECSPKTFIPDSPLTRQFIASGLGGFAATLILNPINVVKLQVQSPSPALLEYSCKYSYSPLYMFIKIMFIITHQS